MIKNVFRPSKLKKNLLIAVSGTGLAQLIHLGSTPIISRIYEPKFFGEFALFNSLLGIFTVFTLLKMDLALIGADESEIPSFKKLFRRLTLLVIAVIILVFAYKLITAGFSYIYFFLILALVPSNEFWSNRAIQNRDGNFKKLSLGKILENSISTGSSLLLGLLNLKEYGLLFGKIFGLLSSAVFFRRRYEKKPFINSKELLNKYKKFPKFSFPAELLVHLNLNLSVFVFTYYFSAIEVGFIGLTTRVLSVPVNFISISFFDVFKQKAMNDFKETGEFLTIFIKFLFMLSLIAFLMIGTLYFFSEDLFAIVFGEEWRKAGIYAKYLSILYAVRLVALPLVYSFEITNKNHYNFIFQALYLIGGITALAFSYNQYQSDIISIKAYSTTLAIIYTSHIIMALKNTKKAKA